MQVHTLLGILQYSDSDGLTFAEILADIPHDPAAIVVYVLVAFSVGLVFFSGRRRAPRAPQTGE